MMGVYIKGMEMPENCRDCPFSSGGNRWVMPCCILVGEDMERYEYNHRRMGECPLIPVPPHGRLIDADALLKRIDAEWNGRTVFRAATIVEYIHEAPTIIPADGRRKDPPCGTTDK